MTSVYGSSSPSYPMMISMDGARAWMEGGGKGTLPPDGGANRRPAGAVSQPLGGALDPTRLTLNAVDGPALARALEARGLWPEMEDGGHVVLILTGMDSEEDLDRLECALEEVPALLGVCPPIPAPPLPERVLSPVRRCSPRRSNYPWRTAPGECPPSSWPLSPGCRWWPRRTDHGKRTGLFAGNRI